MIEGVTAATERFATATAHHDKAELTTSHSAELGT